MLVAALLLLQRFAVPVGQEQLAALVPVVSLLVLIGWAAGGFRVDRRRLVLVTVMTGTAVLLTLVQLVAGATPSLLSVLLLGVLYVPAALVPVAGGDAGRRVSLFFVRCMAVAAVLSLAQYAVQSAGARWRDWLAELVPPDLLLQEFNRGNPITYGSDIDRATAIVFIEPSFLSLFLGVAVLLALRLRLRWPVVALLIAGIVPTVAGNGLVVVLLGAAALLLTTERRVLLTLLPTAVLAGAVSLLTPLGALYLQRSTEGGGTDSSTGLRIVQPYVQLLPPPLEQPGSALIGAGAGAAGPYIASRFTEPLLATVIPKIVFEYGMLGVVGILLPLLLLLLAPLRRRPELLGLAVTFFVLNASLQAAIMVYLVVLVMLWLPELQPPTGGRSGAERPLTRTASA